MQLRRTTALLAGGLLLAVPLVSACGFSGKDAATNREYTPAAGTNNRDAGVDVLNAVVVSDAAGSGTLIATFVNNAADADASVDAVAAAPGGPELTVEEFAPVEIAPRGAVNLAESDSPITVTGDFEAGTFLDLQFTFGDGDSVSMEVPVVPDDHEFDGLDGSS